MYVGGEFERVAGQARTNVAAIGVSKGNLLGWYPRATGKPVSDERDVKHPEVRDLLVSGSTVYVAGFFGRIGGAQRANAAALDAATGRARSWNPRVRLVPFGTVTAIAAYDSVVYLGGNLEAVGGVERKGVAAVDPVLVERRRSGTRHPTQASTLSPSRARPCSPRDVQAYRPSRANESRRTRCIYG